MSYLSQNKATRAISRGEGGVCMYHERCPIKLTYHKTELTGQFIGGGGSVTELYHERCPIKPTYHKTKLPGKSIGRGGRGL